MGDFFSSFSLLNSTALFGLLSLIIPVLIHMLNRSRGRLVMIGNIDFVKYAKRKRIAEVKPTQWILFILRLCILTLTSLIIAKLAMDIGVSSRDKEHVYLSPEWLVNASDSELQQLRETHADAAFFVLSKPFKNIVPDSFKTLRQSLKAGNFSSFPTGIAHDLKSGQNISIDTLILELENRNDKAEDTFLYVTNQRENFTEIRPELAEVFQWRVKSVSPQELPFPTIKVSVFFDKSRELDIEYLKLAFETFSRNIDNQFEVSYRPLNNGESNTNLSEEAIDWIFWLSDRAINPEIHKLVEQGTYLLTDISIDTDNIPTRQSPRILAKINDLLVTFYRNKSKLNVRNKVTREKSKVDNKSQIVQLLWQDESGDSILSSIQQGKGRFFHFSSRFHHQWTNLVEKTEFPGLLVNLLVSSRNRPKISLVDPSEIGSYQVEQNLNPTHRYSLSKWLIILLCCLWLIERLLSERRKEANG